MLKNIFEFIKILVISLLIILPIRYFIIQPFYVKGASMEPTFHDHEYLIIDEISYRFNDPRRGDVVVFRYPNNPQEYFIKRIVAIPGETVEIIDGGVFIYSHEFPDGFILDESYYLSDSIRTYNTENDPVYLSDKEYYVLGDNRYASKDSRSFGPLNRDLITGKVLLRAWPFNRFDVFRYVDFYNLEN
jgi:signal peptidase I